MAKKSNKTKTSKDENNTIDISKIQEEIIKKLNEEGEITYGKITIKIINPDINEYIATIIDGNTEENIKDENGEDTFDDIDKAIDVAMNHIVNNKLYDNKSTKSNKVNHMLTDEEKIKAFDGPKIIKVFARKVYIDNRKNLTKEQILNTLIDRYEYYDLANSKTGIDFDESTGIVEVYIKFKCKG